jgi:hypothetical protein
VTTEEFQAQRELDAQVHTQVFGVPREQFTYQYQGREHISLGPGGPEFYSTDIAAAWAVHRAMCERLFSARQRYFVSLGEVVRERVGARVVWPDLLSLIEPADFCRAALRSQPRESPCSPAP